MGIRPKKKQELDERNESKRNEIQQVKITNKLIIYYLFIISSMDYYLFIN